MPRVKRLLSRVWPRGLIARVPNAPRALFLTFDDGPDPVHTRPLLDVLERHGARGTFFVVGWHIDERRELVVEMLDRGHAIASHSLTHARMDRIDDAARAHEIDGMAARLAAIDPRCLRLFRPPHGIVSTGFLWFCLRHGHVVALWSRDSLDHRLAAEEIVARFRAEPPVGGDVLLFHDDSPISAAALDELLPAWKAEGFHFPVLADPRRPRSGAAR